MKYIVYILTCADNSFYVGSTNDLKKRLREHNESNRGARYTKGRRPVVLVYQEKYSTITKALRREAEIKSWPRGKKLLLLKRSE